MIIILKCLLFFALFLAVAFSALVSHQKSDSDKGDSEK